MAKKSNKKTAEYIPTPEESKEIEAKIPSIDKQIHDKLETVYNPFKNPKAISIIQQADGNWIGEMNKNGNVVSSRQGDPSSVLAALITHE